MLARSCLMLVPGSAFSLTIVIALIVAGSVSADDALLERGGTIYQSRCASCHGDKGQGVPGSYDEPLFGDSSINELSRLISETMPEGEPEQCVGDDARAAAVYMFESFYSESAQMRLVPPRAALARLTAQQYRQSLSDLFAHFMGRGEVKVERGLTANYFDNAGWKNDKKVLTRVDANIDVDYGQASPVEGIAVEKFAVYWSGAILAPESGTYLLRARGKGSFIVKFLDTETKFFDNHVSSGEMAEHSSTIHLVGGRLYPISVELIKRERKTGNVDISLTLSWKTPKGIEEPIPARNLIPGWAPTAFAPQTPLPPDDRSAGYQRGSTISRQWADATTEGALEFADIAVEKLWPKYAKEAEKKKDGPKGREAARQFCYELLDMANRRPADDDLRKRFVDGPLADAPSDEEAIRRVVLLALKSPRFLYPTIDINASPDFQRASRLALVLWDSVPDKSLHEAGQKGWLGDEKAIRERARRMIQDPRAKAKLRDGMHEWLDLARWEEISKNQELYPGFDASLVADLRTSLDLFIDDIVWSDTSDFRQLMQSDWSYSSDRIAEYYGESWKPTGDRVDGRFSRTASDPAVHAGVITHPLLMSAMAYGDTSSPIFRGVFLVRHILGRYIRPPNDAFTPLSPDLHPDLTTRERVSLQTSPASCQSCHNRINGLGFTLEGFDATGRPRQNERNKPVDASGIYVDRTGAEIKFGGAKELTAYLATSEDVSAAFINRMFLHFVKHPVGAYGENRLDQLKTRFRESGYNIRELVVEMAIIAADPPTTAHPQSNPATPST